MKLEDDFRRDGTIRRKLTTLREERAESWAKMEAIADRAEREARDLRPDEAEKWAALKDRFDSQSRAITRLQDEATFGDGEGGVPSIVLGDGEPRSATGDASHTIGAEGDSALRTIERHVRRGSIQSHGADRLDHMVRHEDPQGRVARHLRAVGDPNYLTAFGKMLADPQSGHLRFSPEEVEAVRRVAEVQSERAISTGTSGTGGGFLLPFELDPSVVISSNGALNPIRQIARVLTIETHDYKGVTSEGVTASYVAEATEATDASPTFVQPTITTAQGRAFIPFSIEWGQDFPEAASELLRLITDGRDTLDAGKFLTGSGTDEPAGLLTGLTTTQRVQTAGAAAYVVADPWALKAEIPSRFVPNATFAANPATWDATFRFVGGSSTEPEQFSGGRGGDFLGRPKVEISTMVSTTTTGSKIMVGGDFAAGYTIVDRLGMTAELVPHLFGSTSNFPTGQRGLYAYWRTGAKVVVPNAFRYLEVK